MGLLKAADVEYLKLTDEDIYSSTDLEGDDFTYTPADADEVEFAGPMIIGGSGVDFDFDSLTLDTDSLGDTVFFASAETEVIFGETVMIGGDTAYALDVPSEYDYQSAYAEETDEQAYYEEEAYTDETEGLEPGENPLLKDFSSMMDTEEDTSAAEEWSKQKKSTMMTRLDDKVKRMMQEQKESLKEQSQQQISFVSASEKQRLVSEAMDSIRFSPDAVGSVDFEKIFQDIADYIENLAWHHAEQLQGELEEERNRMVQSVEEYVENSIAQQRDEMMSEAEDYIARTVQEYKKSLNEDNEFIKAANQIIAQRETILDEAYTKSLTMIQEAEEEQQRIMSEAYEQQEQSRQMLQEAESQVEMMASEAQAEAERIISEANMESARIIEAAEQSHQEIVEAATQDGFNVGYQEGREEAIKENAQLLMETTNALNKLHAAFPVAVKQNEDKLIKLALEISREVIMEELAIKPELCLKSVERAIGKVSDLEKVLIKVNPLDLDLVLPKQEYFRRLLPDVQDFIITGHYSIERGGCLIETNSGTIDAQINTQLAVVEEVFQQIRNEYDFDEEEMEEEEV